MAQNARSRQLDMKLIGSILFCVLIQTVLFGQSANTLLSEADEAYRAEDFGAAELLYRKARQENSDVKSNFNLGNTTYKQERYEEAVEHYLSAANKTNNNLIASDNYFNLGNAYFRTEEYEKSIDAYKQAIKANPDNDEARYNLLMLKMNLQQQEQQQQQDQQSQDGDENSENQDGENSEQQQQDGEQSDQEQNQDQQNPNEENQDSLQNQGASGGEFDSTRLEKQSLDSLDAIKLLQIIQSEEQKLQEKLRKFDSNRKKPDKDW